MPEIMAESGYTFTFPDTSQVGTNNLQFGASMSTDGSTFNQVCIIYEI